MPRWSAPSQHTALPTPGAGAALADTGPRRVGAVADGIDSVRREARRILEEAWDDYRGYSFPHAQVYAHLWLWDSCFHAIAWSAFGDLRAVRELEAVFAAQLPSGFVPHMRYASPSMARGPLTHASGYTQPPVYGHALATIARDGLPVPRPLVAHVEAAFEYLWTRRRASHGLLEIYHPWEAGADDSPRWDGWIGSTEWERPRWTAFDLQALQETEFAESGEAVANRAFTAAPAAFNAIAAHGMRELATVTGDENWQRRATTLATAIDDVLWNPAEALWSDLAVNGPSTSVAVPTLDGVVPALATADPGRAAAALGQLDDAARFAAPYGLAYVARGHELYRGDLYWRGAAWPQMNHLARVAAVRWGRHDLADAIAEMTRRGAAASGFSELWDPATGRAGGAVPQTWAALAAVTRIDQPPAITE